MNVPTLVVTGRGADRVRRGQVWVFQSDVAKVEATPGDLVRVLDQRDNFVCWGFYGPSQLSMRVLHRADERPNAEFFKKRLRDAVSRRQRFAADRDAMRVVHGEADGLPGWLVDKFGDGLVVQSLSLATDQREGELIEWLKETLNPRVIVVRDDGMTREYEGLEDRKGLAFGTDPVVRYHEGKMAFEIDLLADQKTGAYLDQYENHLVAGAYAKGRALDAFCYHGGFGLQLARNASEVVCVDQSDLAITRVRANAERNGVTNLTGVCANAFDYLREAEARNERFDTIVVDPPAFAKRKGAIDAALRGYKELNLRALRLLNPGGIFISASCSAKVTPVLFEEMLISAAKDARRRVQVLERRGASRDHPGLLGIVETEYLKCFVLQSW